MTQKTTKFRQSVRRLKSMIIGGDFRPGERLLEDRLEEILGLGRTPLREALLLLQGEGLVERNHGWYVAETDPSDLPRLFDARAISEGTLAALAARACPPERLRELEDLCTAMETWPEITRGELNKHNVRFHEVIAAAADNRFITEFWEKTLFQHWQLRLPVMFSAEQIVVMQAQHRAIFTAIAEADPERAEMAAREHVNTTRDIVLAALKDLEGTPGFGL
ncbi:GntR family transcriptional regulator [Alloyangia pacifica]|uniref:Transcriptional regulator, GntR family n=1 Tax=Alloyangia pacifica TaxID=311180 RepID=A0A1I6VXF2_9RHOB|nr:GntR family transcriptional regulator [Alloyangia pacifica]SDI20547.1 transcriptional regulator, GntR family [Alloyangia pacifica]SFT18359.1 transcriptional regulator, GntR family [Alloyangia pacifica]